MCGAQHCALLVTGAIWTGAPLLRDFSSGSKLKNCNSFLCSGKVQQKITMQVIPMMYQHLQELHFSPSQSQIKALPGTPISLVTGNVIFVAEAELHCRQYPPRDSHHLTVTSWSGGLSSTSTECHFSVISLDLANNRVHN